MATHAAVLFIEDVARELRISRRSIERLRSERSFPIPELESLDKRPRWSRVAVDRYLAGERTPKRPLLRIAR